MLPYNQFESIPSVLLKLENLKELNLSHNRLLGSIALDQTMVEKLDLSDNQIQNIHTDPSHTYKLTRLNVSHNQIEKLPLVTWNKLQELNVNQNKLKYLFPGNIALRKVYKITTYTFS
jgi:Leucine-rich repeat (LRR) protein